MISTNQFKNGTHIEVDGTVFKIVGFQHVKPGKGGAFVRSKLKRTSDGAVIDKTFRAARSSGRSAPRRARCSTSTPTAPTPTSWTSVTTSSSRSPRTR